MLGKSLNIELDLALDLDLDLGLDLDKNYLFQRETYPNPENVGFLIILKVSLRILKCVTHVNLNVFP